MTRNAGNWDDTEIESTTVRLGFRLKISPTVRAGIKREIRDGKTALALVKYLRNRLAHGSISFAECGDDLTVDDLKDLSDRTTAYLEEVVREVRKFIDHYEFIDHTQRPVFGTS